MANPYTFLLKDIYGYFLVFSRLSTILLTFPGFGSHSLAMRTRIMVGLVLTAATYPVVADHIPPYPDHSLTVLTLVAAEILIGAFIGLCFHVIIHMLDVAGAIISFQASLSNMFVYNPELAAQNTLPSQFLTLGAMAILFTNDLHHHILQCITASYHTIPVAHLDFMGDMGKAMVKMASSSFVLAIQITAPFLVGMTLLFCGMGLLARLMPGIQIFFLAQPLQVAFGLLLLGAALAPILSAFVTYFDQALEGLFP
jgi:flagellar biosynthetic protein FliR